MAEVENLAANSDGQTQKLEDIHAQKLKALEAQVRSPFLLNFLISLLFIRFELEQFKIAKTFFQNMGMLDSGFEEETGELGPAFEAKVEK